LHYSILTSRHETTKCLLKGGARTNARSIYGVTPMTLAVLCDDPHSVRLLIEHGYPITRTYPWNEYPHEQAIRIHSESSALMIAHLGCELKVKPPNPPSHPLTLAANEGLVNLMFLLIYMQPQWINQPWIRRRQYPYALYRLTDVQNQLQKLIKNPFSLKQLCRAKISQSIGKFYTEKIEEFKKTFRFVTDSHLNYLRYNDVLDPNKHFRPVGKHLAFFEINGIEFYWDQRTLRYKKRTDEHLDQDKARPQPPANAITRLTTALVKRKLVTKHVRLNIQSAHNAGRGILPKRTK